MTAPLSAAAAALALFASGPGAGLPVHRTPPLAGTDLAGRHVELSQYLGRVVLVHFWATWCEPCREELPSLARLRKRLSPRGLEVLSVDFGEGKKRIGDFLRALSVDLPVLLDPDHRLAEAWDVGGLPTTFLVDARGRLRLSVFGATDWSEGEALEAVESLLSEASSVSL